MKVTSAPIQSEMSGTTKYDIASRILGSLAKVYGALLTLAAGGLIIAKLSAFAVAAAQIGLQSDFDADRLRRWMHGGWLLGVGLACIAIVTTWKKAKAARAAASDKGQTPRRRRWTKRRGRRMGWAASLLFGGLGGALLGGMLGGSFLLLWFSITYSPFAPQEWVASVSVERERLGPSPRREPVTSTDHPVALIAFFGPLALGAGAGAILGGVCGVTDQTETS